MATTMTFDRWRLMENLSTHWITLAMILTLILLMGLAIVTQSVRRKSLRRRVQLGLTGAILLCAGGGLVAWRYIQPYLEIRHYVTPRVRVAHPEFFGLVPESGTTVGNSAGVNNYADMAHLPMYDRHTVRKPVTYLGQDHSTAYFEMFDRIYSFSGPVKVGGVKQAVLQGDRYTLNDTRYRQLGFIDPTKISTRALVVPAAKTYDLPNATKVYALQTAGFTWTTERSSSIDDVD
ncbi:hypothetical protein [Lacticaseibacillus absianus]|uniref:hypothetical protein n=1 Tax=Lacticaseibacillus absianus TaxID=2729623 RepID=UPI0015CA4246|nr:hypothetical protein [Lacticaseibacillus absianus]